MTAIEQFNAAFNMSLTEPLPGGYLTLEKLSEYARLRGRNDLADAIEEDFRRRHAAAGCGVVGQQARCAGAPLR